MRDASIGLFLGLPSSSPGASHEWIDVECRLAIKHLEKVCGEPALEIELDLSGRNTNWANIR